MSFSQLSLSLSLFCLTEICCEALWDEEVPVQHFDPQPFISLSGQHFRLSAAHTESVLAHQEQRVHFEILHRALYSHRRAFLLKTSLFRKGVNKEFVRLGFGKAWEGAVLHQGEDFPLCHGKAGRPRLFQTLSDRFSCVGIQIHLQKQHIGYIKLQKLQTSSAINVFRDH